MTQEQERELGYEDLPATERIELLTVGIDIGSSTSHLLFSRLKLARMGAALSSRYVIVDKKVLHESDVLLTPYVRGTTIDTAALEQFIRESYRKAEVKPQQVDTGALILTGEAVKKTNAEAIGNIFAQEAGRFVAVSAGDNLEAIMAAHGSGAVEMSKRNRNTIMSVDVGGGTSKVAIVTKGNVVDTAAISVGARLIVVDGGGIVTRLEEEGYRVGQELGLDLKVGQPLLQSGSRNGTAKLDEMAGLLAGKLFEVIGRQPLSPLARELMRTPELSSHEAADAIIFSGGVSEYIYGKESRSFGDLGAALAAGIRTRAQAMGIPMLEPVQRIRATVIGASQYTVQVSGNTIYVSSDAALPVRNLQVVAPRFALDERLHSQGVKASIARALRRFDLRDGDRPVALALRWEGPPTHQRIETLAEGIVQGLSKSLDAGLPLVLVFDGDVGKLVGANLAERLGPATKVISLDGVELREFDYVDIGEVIQPAGAAPIIIKSLVFPTLSDWYSKEERNY